MEREQGRHINGNYKHHLVFSFSSHFVVVFDFCRNSSTYGAALLGGAKQTTFIKANETVKEWTESHLSPGAAAGCRYETRANSFGQVICFACRAARMAKARRKRESACLPRARRRPIQI